MNLYNILIVDDEAFIVDWLSNLLETKKDLNIFIYRAYTTARALELIERTRIDLLISDIQMPTYTGFELAEKLHQLWPNSKTILLTAFSDFNYAQKAIQLGIVSYVLKTAEDSEIISEIRKTLQIIDRECNQQALINNIEKDLKSFHSRLNTQIFFLWLKGYYTSDALSPNIKSLGFDLYQSKRFMLIICRTDTPDLPDNKQLQNLMKPFQIQRIIEHYLAPHLIQSSYEVQDNLLLGILQLHPDLKNTGNIISSTLELAQTACLETLKCRISCLISPEGTAEDIPSFWSGGKSLLPQFSAETDFIYNYDNHHLPNDIGQDGWADKASLLLKTSYHNSMKRHLENGNKSCFYEQLNEVCQYLSQNANWHNNISLQIYFSLVLVFINYINQKKIGTQVAFHVGTGLLFRPWLAENWHSIEQNIYQMADSLFFMRQENEQNNIIQKVQNYIDSHITEDISLLDLSNITGYSTNYLSKYYSNSTGSTISEYIAEKKMERINHLMSDTDMNIGEISAFMGFHSRTYFNNYIKRLTGMSPQQYREALHLTEYEKP